MYFVTLKCVTRDPWLCRRRMKTDAVHTGFRNHRAACFRPAWIIKIPTVPTDVRGKEKEEKKGRAFSTACLIRNRSSPVPDASVERGYCSLSRKSPARCRKEAQGDAWNYMVPQTAPTVTPAPSSTRIRVLDFERTRKRTNVRANLSSL